MPSRLPRPRNLLLLAWPLHRSSAHRWQDRAMSPVAAVAPPLAGLTVGILGGTGDQGRGLARRFGLAGLPVLLGSRTAERAAEAAEGLAGVSPCLNAEAAAGGPPPGRPPPPGG